MDEKKDTRQETDEERARRLRRQRRLRQEMRRRRRRRALILRGVLAVAGILIVVLLIWGISALAGKIGGGEKKTAVGEQTEQTGQTETAEEEELEEVAAEKVLHLSFGSLIADTEAAFGQEDRQAALSMDQGHLTVDELIRYCSSFTIRVTFWWDFTIWPSGMRRAGRCRHRPSGFPAGRSRCSCRRLM